MDGYTLARWRRSSLLLGGGRLPADPVEVVRHLGAVQAQDLGPAQWSIGQRTARPAVDAVAGALAAGRLVRTHVLRSTWHVVLPEDLRWMQALTAPRVRSFLAYYDRQLDISPAALKTSARRLQGALAGTALTRAQLAPVLQATGQRLAHLVMHAELDALICSGPPAGKAQTYALVSERVPPAPERDPDDALAELTRRYFTSHGPATVKDFAWWSSLPTSTIRRGLEMVPLQRLDVDGVTYWTGSPLPRRRPPSPEVRLLHGYDEYVVGYTESKYLLDVSGAARRSAAPQVSYNSLVMLDGQLVGRWKRQETTRSVTVHLSLDTRLTAEQAAELDREVAAFGSFLGRPVELAGS